MGRMLPLIVIFCCCIVPQIIMNMHTMSLGNRQRIFAQCLVVFFSVMFVVYLIVFIHCGIGLYRLKKKYEDGEQEKNFIKNWIIPLQKPLKSSNMDIAQDIVPGKQKDTICGIKIRGYV